MSAPSEDGDEEVANSDEEEGEESHGEETEDSANGDEEADGDDDAGEEGDDGGDEAPDDREERPAAPAAEVIAPARNRRRRNPIRFREPASDNDPDPPEDDAPENRPRGWTRQATKVKRHKFRGENTGPTFNVGNKRPVDLFWNFFPLSVLMHIVTWTNIKLVERGLKRTTVEELKAYIGILLIMGVTKLNNIYDYWSTRPSLNNKLISSTMSRQRFEALQKYTAYCRPADDPDTWPDDTDVQRQHRYNHMKKNPLYAVKPLWDAILNNCLRRYNPLRHIALDEAMVRYKGAKACVKKFVMKGKPIKTGFKIYAVCESATGYMVNFAVHRNIVGQKMDDIAVNVLTPFLASGTLSFVTDCTHRCHLLRHYSTTKAISVALL